MLSSIPCVSLTSDLTKVLRQKGKPAPTAVIPKAREDLYTGALQKNWSLRAKLTLASLPKKKSQPLEQNRRQLKQIPEYTENGQRAET